MPYPELLVPAGDLETLKIAVIYGADAVYLGGEEFSLRAKAKNFSMQDLKDGIHFAHEYGAKIYVAANIFAYNNELKNLREFFKKLKNVKPDALIISDLGVLMIAKEVLPDIQLHISTQRSSANYETFKSWHNLGVKRVVAARELTLEEIKEIRNNIPDGLEIECFVHGAMCVSYSGNCMLSNYLTGRDGNHGECTHPCRWKYTLYEKSNNDEYSVTDEQNEYNYFLNSKDLCMVENIPDLIEAGIDSFKIEGRMKSALYVAAATRTYRKAIDDLLESPIIYRDNIDWYREEISKCTHREYSSGFFYGKTDKGFQIYENSTYINDYIYLGFIETVNENGYSVITQRNKFYVGEEIEIMKPNGKNIIVQVKGIYDEDKNFMESAPYPKQKLFLDLDVIPNVYDILRKKLN